MRSLEFRAAWGSHRAPLLAAPRAPFLSLRNRRRRQHACGARTCSRRVSLGGVGPRAHRPRARSRAGPGRAGRHRNPDRRGRRGPEPVNSAAGSGARCSAALRTSLAVRREPRPARGALESSGLRAHTCGPCARPTSAGPAAEGSWGGLWLRRRRRGRGGAARALPGGTGRGGFGLSCAAGRARPSPGRLSAAPLARPQTECVRGAPRPAPGSGGSGTDANSGRSSAPPDLGRRRSPGRPGTSRTRLHARGRLRTGRLAEPHPTTPAHETARRGPSARRERAASPRSGPRVCARACARGRHRVPAGAQPGPSRWPRAPSARPSARPLAPVALRLLAGHCDPQWSGRTSLVLHVTNQREHVALTFEVFGVRIKHPLSRAPLRGCLAVRLSFRSFAC